MLCGVTQVLQQAQLESTSLVLISETLNGWLWAGSHCVTNYVDLASLEFIKDLPISASPVLGLKALTTTADWLLWIFYNGYLNVVMW